MRMQINDRPLHVCRYTSYYMEMYMHMHMYIKYSISRMRKFNVDNYMIKNYNAT